LWDCNFRRHEPPSEVLLRLWKNLAQLPIEHEQTGLSIQGDCQA
jgi:hypothetical protein